LFSRTLARAILILLHGNGTVLSTSQFGSTFEFPATPPCIPPEAETGCPAGSAQP
jgi:hypothetical protein